MFNFGDILFFLPGYNHPAILDVVKDPANLVCIDQTFFCLSSQFVYEACCVHGL